MTASLTQTNLFDYTALDTETRVVVQQRTTEIKSLMRRAAQDIIDIGQKLIEVKTRLGHGNFGTWLLAEFQWGDDTARNFINVAKRFGQIPKFSDFAPSALYLLASPSTPEPARLEALERAEAGEPITYTKAREIVNEYRLAGAPAGDPDEDEPAWTDQYRHIVSLPEPAKANDTTIVQSQPMVAPDDYSGDEWYTPIEYINAAREVLGTIDLDPASCLAAQALVKARQIYTVDDDGLQQSWRGRVWLNPPYSMPLIQKFVKRLIDHYESGDVTAAIILTNNCTDACWFHSLLESYPACFTRGRIPFWRPGQSTFATRQGQAFFYLGPTPARFVGSFSQFGIVVARAR
jgi:hypothetical protein